MIEAILKYWPVLLVLLNGFTAWLAWSLRQLARREVSVEVSAAIAPLLRADAKLAEDVDEQGERLVALEESVKHLPRREDIDKLTAAVAAVDKALAAQRATLDAVQASGRATQDSVDRLYRFFLEKGA